MTGFYRKGSVVVVLMTPVWVLEYKGFLAAFFQASTVEQFIGLTEF